ncbi:MAG: PTS sugar transporter subunit IIB [Caldicoprobacterales bacterium]|jgi:PTS system ascorbate-specific IIB component|nr:PTS sugar transporter subunit IIB [Clostridiales bacterium]
MAFKAKRLSVLAVCGAGVGSSIMMKANAEEVLEKHGVRARVTAADITSAKGNSPDVLVTTLDIYKVIKDIKAGEVVILENMVSMKELEEKLVPACKKVLERMKEK